MPARTARKQDDKRSQTHARGTTTPLEWIIAGFGALVLAAMLGYLLHYAATQSESDPVPTIEALSVAPASGAYLVRYRVRNEANGTAASLQVIAELRRGGETVEEREAVIDYLPPYSTREGGFYFSQDPAAYELVLSVGGYSEP